MAESRVYIVAIRYATNILSAAAIWFACGCNSSSPQVEVVEPATKPAPNKLIITCQVDIEKGLVEYMVRNNSDQPVIINSTHFGMTAYVVRGPRKIPIVMDHTRVELPGLRVVDIVRMLPGSSYGLTDKIDTHLTGKISAGETVVAVLHPVRLGNFDSQVLPLVEKHKSLLLQESVESSETKTE